MESVEEDQRTINVEDAASEEVSDSIMEKTLGCRETTPSFICGSLISILCICTFVILAVYFITGLKLTPKSVANMAYISIGTFVLLSCIYNNTNLETEEDQNMKNDNKVLFFCNICCGLILAVIFTSFAAVPLFISTQYDLANNSPFQVQSLEAFNETVPFNENYPSDGYRPYFGTFVFSEGFYFDFSSPAQMSKTTCYFPLYSPGSQVRSRFYAFFQGRKCCNGEGSCSSQFNTYSTDGIEVVGTGVTNMDKNLPKIAREVFLSNDAIILDLVGSVSVEADAAGKTAWTILPFSLLGPLLVFLYGVPVFLKEENEGPILWTDSGDPGRGACEVIWLAYCSLITGINMFTAE